MRFAFCAYKHFPYGGLSRDMLRIIEECRRRGHEIVVYSGEWHGSCPEGVEVKIIPSMGLTNHSRAAVFHRRLRQHISAAEFDAVVGFNKMPGLDIYYAADYCYVGHVVPRYGLLYRCTPRYHYFRKFERAVFGADNPTKILCLSEREKSIYQQFHHTPDDRFFLLPPTLDRTRLVDYSSHSAARCRRRLGIADATHLILFVGSGFKTKGLDRAIRALAALPNGTHKDARLFVIGQDDPRPFQRLARRLRVADRIEFLGGRSDVPELLQAGDLLIHPAYRENTGMILLEAITSGLPVLATEVCGYAHHIECAQAGKVLPSPFEQDALNRELADMLVSDQRRRWRRNGLEYRSRADLYSMPVRAAEMIEQWASEKATEPRMVTKVRHPSTLVWFREDFGDANNARADFENIMAISGEVYREAPGRRTLRFTKNGKSFFLKAHSGVGWREIAKNLLYFRLPVVGANNEWHGIHFLRRIGVDSMSVVAYGVSGRNPARRRSFIVTEELPATTSLEEYTQRWITCPPKNQSQIHFKRWLIAKVAEIARTMHRNGGNHRDFYLCHFLLNIAGTSENPVPGGTAIYVIDLHRMQLRPRTPLRWVVKDLAGLHYSSMDIGLTQRDLFRFITRYSGKPLRDTLTKDEKFWRRVKTRGLNLYASERRKTEVHSSQPKRQAALPTTLTH